GHAALRRRTICARTFPAVQTALFPDGTNETLPRAVKGETSVRIDAHRVSVWHAYSLPGQEMGWTVLQRTSPQRRDVLRDHSVDVFVTENHVHRIDEFAILGGIPPDDVIACGRLHTHHGTIPRRLNVHNPIRMTKMRG